MAFRVLFVVFVLSFGRMANAVLPYEAAVRIGENAFNEAVRHASGRAYRTERLFNSHIALFQALKLETSVCADVTRGPELVSQIANELLGREDWFQDLAGRVFLGQERLTRSQLRLLRGEGTAPESPSAKVFKPGQYQMGKAKPKRGHIGYGFPRPRKDETRNTGDRPSAWDEFWDGFWDVD